MNKPFRPIVSFHPGRTLDAKLKEMNLSVEDFASQSQVPSFIIEGVIAGNISVSADMALAFEQVTLIPAHYWLNAQHNYDDYILRDKATSYRSRLSEFKNTLLLTLSATFNPSPSGKVASILV